MKIEDQPPPTSSMRRPAWDLVIELTETLWRDNPSPPDSPGGSAKIHALVIADMRERDQVGRARYGTPLQANNGRRHLIDAYQELQDFAVYLRAWLDECGVGPLLGAHKADGDLVLCFLCQAIVQLHVLRDLIERGL